MASIQKRGSKYIVRWWDRSKRQHTRTCPDMRTAKTLQREIESALALGRDWQPAQSREEADITTIAAEFLANRANRLRSATLTYYGGLLDTFVAYLRAHHSADRATSLPASLLSRSVLEQYHEWLRTTPIRKGQLRTAATIRKMVEVVYTLWQWAEASERWPGLARPRKIEVAKAPAKAVQAPTWEQMGRAVKKCGGWHRQLTMVLYYTGLRCGETLQLLWSDVDLERGTLTIRPEISKTNKGRIVPLHDALLRVWRQPDQWTRNEDGWVVASPYKLRQPKTSRLGDVWERAGVPPHVWERSPHHAFRRGFKSGLLSLGAPPDAVDYLQGHTLGGGARARYIDPFVAFDLRRIVNMVPTIDFPAQEHTKS